ncbi:hypothetical protein [Flavobacterium sp.]|uniref:hypothetical protein n=1 Tax=Flavobacterium sp. TaxID=239 RepID=UPI0025C220F1|nr:hypothetical protein [Flavobacterium sp.]
MPKSIPHSSEEYYCTNCKKFLTLLDVNLSWKCPTCSKYTHIRIINADSTIDQSCERILASELRSDDIILLHRNDDFKDVFSVRQDGDNIFANIKGHGGLKMHKDDTILKLVGGWYH